MKFDNKYTDFENNETELTEKELEWFYSVVTKFHQLPEATGIVIVNRNHEELSRKNRNPHGLSWTTDYSNMNIQTRDKALADSYAEFFKMDEDGAEDNMEVNEEVDSESVKEAEETVDSEDDINDGYESFAESIMADSEEHEA